VLPHTGRHNNPLPRFSQGFPRPLAESRVDFFHLIGVIEAICAGLMASLSPWRGIPVHTLKLMGFRQSPPDVFCDFTPPKPAGGRGRERFPPGCGPEELGHLLETFFLGFLAKARHLRLAWDSPAKASFKFFSVCEPGNGMMQDLRDRFSFSPAIQKPSPPDSFYFFSGVMGGTSVVMGCSST
jgi:hypothetical protein